MLFKIVMLVVSLIEAIGSKKVSNAGRIQRRTSHGVVFPTTSSNRWLCVSQDFRTKVNDLIESINTTPIFVHRCSIRHVTGTGVWFTKDDTLNVRDRF